MSILAQPGFSELLERAGAIPPRHGRGKWTCPECKRPALSVNADKAVYHCFYAGCGFSGGPGTLRKRLGIASERLPSAEYRELCRKQERAHDAAERLYSAAKARRFELYDQLCVLAGIQVGAHRAGLSETAWRALAMVYREQPAIEAELDRLGSGNAGTVLECLSEAKV